MSDVIDVTGMSGAVRLARFDALSEAAELAWFVASSSGSEAAERVAMQIEELRQCARALKVQVCDE